MLYVMKVMCWIAISVMLVVIIVSSTVHSVGDPMDLRFLLGPRCCQNGTLKQSASSTSYQFSTLPSLWLSDLLCHCLEPSNFYRASYALAVYAMVVCLSVSVCLCLSQVGVLLKRLNVGTRKQRRMIAQGH